MPARPACSASVVGRVRRSHSSRTLPIGIAWENLVVRTSRAQRRSAAPRAPELSGGHLRHVIVVGGSAAEWAATGPDRWTELVGELARVVRAAGGEWLTLRPYGGGLVAHGPTGLHVVEGCSVLIDGTPDGRDRLVAAIRRVHASASGATIDEAALAAAMLAPATAEADLALVLGPSDRLPPSLVWELAYSELVFTDCSWSDLGEKHLHDAIVEFGQRERRFGGLPS
jgi:undecaprenyl diphosphate synthase